MATTLFTVKVARRYNNLMICLIFSILIVIFRRFLNLNFAKGIFNLNQSLAMLLDQFHFLEFEDFVGVCLLVDLFFWATVCLFKGGDSLVKLEFVYLLFEL